MEGKNGRTYHAARGPHEGQTITVVGPDPLLPDGYWLVRAEDGATWGVANIRLERVLA